MRRVGVSSTVLFLVAAICATAVAQSLHVSPNGNDKNPGTADRPLKTGQAAAEKIRRMKTVDEIIFHAGVYNGEILLRPVPKAKPEDVPPLTVRPAKDEEVIFDGGTAVKDAQPVAGVPGVFRVAGKTNAMWETDTRTRYVQAADARTVAVAPGTFAADGEDVVFHTSDGKPPAAHDIGMAGTGIGFRCRRPNVTIEGFLFRNHMTGVWSTAVILNAPNVVVKNCRSVNNFCGFFFHSGAVNARVENCAVEDVACGIYGMGRDMQVLNSRFVKKRDAFAVPSYWQDDTGVQYYYPAKSGIVRGNLVKGFDNGIYIKTSGNFTVEHNTVIDAGAALYRSKWKPGNRYDRNIIVRAEQPFRSAIKMKAGMQANDNCIWDSREMQHLRDAFDGPANAGYGKRNFMADPGFAAAEAGDYRLLPDSPCVALGGVGRPIGAFQAVPRDFNDAQPPVVELELSKPAARAGGVGEVSFELDPWLGGGRRFVRRAYRPDPDADYVTRVPGLNLMVRARDAMNRPDKMRIRIGDGEWGDEAPFAVRQGVTVPAEDGVHAVAVRVSDTKGNWSTPVALRVRYTRRPPASVAPPTVHANRHGVVFSFRTAVPAFASVEYGPDKTLGLKKDAPSYIHRHWLTLEGGDWITEWKGPRTQHHVALIAPDVEPKETYYYRIRTIDAAGNTWVGPPARIKVTGKPRALRVAPGGKDEDGRGTKGEPFRTLQFAVDRALPGDYIMLAPGVYLGETYLSHGGVKDAPITIEAEKAGTVILDGVRKHVLLRLEAAPHVRVRDLEIRWYPLPTAGVYLADSPHFMLEGCNIWNDLWRGASAWPDGQGVFAHRSPGFVAERNLLFRQNWGIELLQCPGSRIVNNTACQNVLGAVGLEFSVEGSEMMDNSFAFNGNDQIVIYTFDDAELKTFRSDYNNFGTVIRKKDVKPGQKLIEPREQIFRTGSKAMIQYGGTTSKRFSTLAEWRKFSGQDAHSINADPRYVDVIGHDFRLGPDSPNIKAGRRRSAIGAFGMQKD